ENALQRCAEQTLPDLVAHELQVYIWSRLQPCLGLKINPKALDIPKSAEDAVAHVVRRLTEATGSELGEATLRKKHRQIENRLRQTLRTDHWRKECRGRDILRRFSSKYLGGLPYY